MSVARRALNKASPGGLRTACLKSTSGGVPRKGGEYGEGRSGAVKRYYSGSEHHISWLEDSL